MTLDYSAYKQSTAAVITQSANQSDLMFYMFPPGLLTLLWTEVSLVFTY